MACEVSVVASRASSTERGTVYEDADLLEIYVGCVPGNLDEVR